MKALWTNKALNRLQRVQQLHDYLGKEQPAGLLVVDRLTRLVETVAEDPQVGRPMPYFEGEDIREVIDGTYRLVYRILPDEVHVLTVRHTPWLLPTRFLLEP